MKSTVAQKCARRRLSDANDLRRISLDQLLDEYPHPVRDIEQRIENAGKGRAAGLAPDPRAAEYPPPARGHPRGYRGAHAPDGRYPGGRIATDTTRITTLKLNAPLLRFLTWALIT